jgi:predicted GIY-YIG superfamily endonuclease
MDRQSYVYLLASKPYGTLYIGVTADLVQRVWQHREKIADGLPKSTAFPNSSGTKSMKTSLGLSSGKSS